MQGITRSVPGWFNFLRVLPIQRCEKGTGGAAAIFRFHLATRDVYFLSDFRQISKRLDDRTVVVVAKAELF